MQNTESDNEEIRGTLSINIQLDQHFMVNKTALKLIAMNIQQKEDDVVLEIGFGKGNLTEYLVEKSKVIAVDIDPNFNFIHENVQIIHANILDVIDDLKFNKICANIPYSISEPLMWKLFGKDIEKMVITFGINFAEILTNKDTKLGIITNSIYDTKLLKVLPKKYFDPIPRTDSAIVIFKKKKKPTEAERIIFELIKQGDKKLKNALLNIFKEKFTKNEVRTKLESSENQKFLDKNIRMISNEDFLKLLLLIKSLA